MRNKMHQTFCRNSKILHFFGIRSEIYPWVFFLVEIRKVGMLLFQTPLDIALGILSDVIIFCLFLSRFWFDTENDLYIIVFFINGSISEA